MLSFLKNIIKKYSDQSIFRKNNRNVSFDWSLLLRKPQYISVGSNSVFGIGSKLMCWDTYIYKTINMVLTPQVSIGENFRATRNLTIQCAGKIQIGDNVLVASDVFIIDYNHGNSPLTDSYLETPLEVGRVKIEDGVWIGNNVIILPNTQIGMKSIIGAGSVVTKDIPPYSIAVGNPAQVVKTYNFVSGKWESCSKY